MGPNIATLSAIRCRRRLSFLTKSSKKSSTISARTFYTTTNCTAASTAAFAPRPARRRTTTTTRRARLFSCFGLRISKVSMMPCRKRSGPVPSYTCAARCPFQNSPGGLVIIMREVAIKHGMQSAKDVLRPFLRVLLKVISTGNQLAPNMITRETFPDRVKRHQGRCAAADPAQSHSGADHAHHGQAAGEPEDLGRFTPSGEATGVLSVGDGRRNPFDVVNDVMDEERDEYNQRLEEQKQQAQNAGADRRVRDGGSLG